MLDMYTYNSPKKQQVLNGNMLIHLIEEQNEEHEIEEAKSSVNSMDNHNGSFKKDEIFDTNDKKKEGQIWDQDTMKLTEQQDVKSFI